MYSLYIDTQSPKSQRITRISRLISWWGLQYFQRCQLYHTSKGFHKYTNLRTGLNFSMGFVRLLFPVLSSHWRGLVLTQRKLPRIRWYFYTKQFAETALDHQSQHWKAHERQNRIQLHHCKLSQHLPGDSEVSHSNFPLLRHKGGSNGCCSKARGRRCAFERWNSNKHKIPCAWIV